MTLSILADIGGTNTRVALAEGMHVIEASVARFANAEYKARGQDIAAILADYLLTSGQTVSGVCVAAAGPVQDGVATMTNLDWVIDADKLRAATGAVHVAILNDLQAQGQALGHIAPSKLRKVIDGPHAPGAMLVVGLGTGVNAAPVHGAGASRVVPPSECGHVNMPVRSEEDLSLMRFVETLLAGRGEVAHCGVEEVLSGRGLINLHAFAAEQIGDSAATTSAQVFTDLEKGHPAAIHAATLYTRILAQTLADLALIHLPYGGIYLIGGMARAMTPHFARLGLTDHFRETRRVDLLEKDFSVTVVEDDFAALTGCAAYLAAQTA
ncbi:MAG: ROK family protein [Pseudotabrizicola sp.]|uniref:glucokinase n=1 Tax=Pseudotabrizicola sp. TaxID=2939647 RepID=UPI0027156265|nr:ROK family protein [Pseudotabrizicola sp.]MDO8884492.1 ROK family protein [Pseudotabrizicola sp.]MDP2082688.1 ROK family protein [Pseudotabrizicola sp.]MDZ7573584.1 ROK family protein [Pseudotabrizicola sp.]